jgi:hypothetical protein
LLSNEDFRRVLYLRENERKNVVSIERIYEKIEEVNHSLRAEIVNEDLCSYSNVGGRNALFKEVKNYLSDKVGSRIGSEKNTETSLYDIVENMADDLFNLIDVGIVFKDGTKVGFLLLNREHSLSTDSDELLFSVEVKVNLLQNVYGWNLVLIGENDWLAMNENQRRKWIEENLTIEVPEEEFVEDPGSMESEANRNKGYSAKRKNTGNHVNLKRGGQRRRSRTQRT